MPKFASKSAQTVATPRIHALIVAAGVGKRFGGSLPKQYTRIHDQTVLQHSVAALAQVAPITHCHIVIARDDDIAKTLDFALPITWVEGEQNGWIRCATACKRFGRQVLTVPMIGC
nr:2-C-methyl-D-erythritol 4-phosphate cytidylyltransferase [Moraxella atlantae]